MFLTFKIDVHVDNVDDEKTTLKNVFDVLTNDRWRLRLTLDIQLFVTSCDDSLSSVGRLNDLTSNDVA